MQVTCFSKWSDLASYAADWDRLAADEPFRSWTWLSHWWRHYGPDADARRRLAVLVAKDDAGVPVGIAPLYLDHSAIEGRALRLLGSGEVCSDYLGILCRKADEKAVVESLVDYLLKRFDDGPEGAAWDLLHLDGIDAADTAVAALADGLTASNCTIHRREGVNCWRLDLPDDWATYLASLSKNIRRDASRLERELVTAGRVKLRSFERAEEVPQALDLLIELHQKRRNMLGESGCFASERFLNFHRAVAPEMSARGQARFDLLELDGRPIAAEYQLASDWAIYAYQTGIDPDSMQHQPGKLLNLMILRRAIQRGDRVFDFLRGDEPYKARFGARPRPTFELRIVPPRTVARIRHNVWLAGSNVKKWIKRKRMELSDGQGRCETASGD